MSRLNPEQTDDHYYREPSSGMSRLNPEQTDDHYYRESSSGMSRLNLNRRMITIIGSRAQE